MALKDGGQSVAQYSPFFLWLNPGRIHNRLQLEPVGDYIGDTTLRFFRRLILVVSLILVIIEGAAAKDLPKFPTTITKSKILTSLLISPVSCSGAVVSPGTVMVVCAGSENHPHFQH